MNGFDVRAVGWIVTRDVCSEGLRTFLGLKPKLDRSALEDLGRRWHRVASCVRDDELAMSLGDRILRPRIAPLSERTEEAMKAFLERLVASSPNLYRHQALRSRCLGEGVQLIASFVCGVMLASAASPDIPILGWASLSFILLACWFLVTARQLFVAWRLVARLATQAAALA